MEFNPSFSFEVERDADESHPWEFAGALKQAPKLQPGQTTVDEKIRCRVEKNSNKAQITKANDKKRKRATHEADSDDSDEGSDSEDEVNSEYDSEEEDVDDLPHVPGEDRMDEGSSDDDSETGADASDSEDGSSVAGSMSDVGNSDDEDDAEDSDGDHHNQAGTGGQSVETGEDSDMNSEGGGNNSNEDMDQASTKPKKKAGSAAKRSGGFFADTPKETKFQAKSFSELNLSRPLTKACSVLGYTDPTPIQAACIPLALAGRDVVGSAITGSGKTAAFALPLLERLLFRQRRVAATYVLVLTPVRELAVQVHSMICKLAQFTDIRAALVVGGLSMNQQASELRKGPEIVVATPGRIIDHIMNTMSFELDALSTLVLDEADRLLDMGFMEEIKQLVRLAPVKRQTLLFSATMTDEVRKLIELSLNSPVRIAADANAAAPRRLRQEVLRLKGSAANDKDAILLALCARTLHDSRTIIFCAQKWKAHKLKILMGLSDLAPAAELHGDMTQAARLESLEQFRKGEVNFLLATDVAARGLDILGVQTVINYDCPSTLDPYLHRIGRTARAGEAGLAITFVEDGDRGLLKLIVKKVQASLTNRVVPANTVAGWRVRTERLYPQVEEIIQEEKQEKELRKAEMLGTKAENMIEYRAEIMSRPKKEWFQTGKEKQDITDATKERADEEAEATRKGKNARAIRNAEHKGNEKTRKAPPHVQETEVLMGRVKAAKSAARHMREGGMQQKESTKMALAAVGAKHSEKQKKKKKVVKKSDDEGDGVGRAPSNSRVYEGGGKTGQVIKPKTGASKQDKAKLARGGKGKSQFKGKSRFKRSKK